MCGIAGIAVRGSLTANQLETLTDTLLNGIDWRGGHATGFYAWGHRVTDWQKASCDAPTFRRHRRLLPLGANRVLLHTRWATHGLPAFPENNHPLKRGPFLLVHNGIVSNTETLYREADRTPFGEVDSESIAALFAHAGTIRDAIPRLETIHGSAAIGVTDERDGTTFVARISENPVHILETRRVILFASCASAIVAAHKAAIGRIGVSRVRELTDGEGVIIGPDGTTETVSFPFHVWPRPRITFPYSWGYNYERTEQESTPPPLRAECASCGDVIDGPGGTLTYSGLEWPVCDACTQVWPDATPVS